MTRTRRVLGIMTGTSLDGVDLVLCTCRGRTGVEWNHHQARPFPPGLRRRLHSVARGNGSPWETAQLHHDLGRFLARTAGAVRPWGQLDAVGLHGQTVFHRPHSRHPATFQLGEPAYLAEALQVPVVSNFRAADLAAGGQGAPLATLFHQVAFARRGAYVAVQNLGGIGNVTALDWTDRKAPVPRILAFDTGPANLLLDLAVREHSGGRRSLDRDGRSAGRGWVDATRVERWLRHPYFRRPPPKSTGRELFGEAFWQHEITPVRPRLRHEDLLATLCWFTARSIAVSYDRFLRTPSGSLPDTVLLSGGGAANPVLRAHIDAALEESIPNVRLRSVDEAGWPRQTVEGAAFALLAHYRLSGWPGNLPETTGARHPVLLGQVSTANAGE